MDMEGKRMKVKDEENVEECGNNRDEGKVDSRKHLHALAASFYSLNWT